MKLHTFIDFFKGCFFSGRLGNKDFKQEYWRNVKNRRHYIWAIMEDPTYIGKTKCEIEAFFGQDESKHLYMNRWRYFIKSKGKKEYILAFYFEDDRLIDIRYEYKNIA